MKGSTPTRYSTAPISRLQFLMLRAIEGGASLTEATDEALAWGGRHPDQDRFEHRPYAAWDAAGDNAQHDEGAGTPGPRDVVRGRPGSASVSVPVRRSRGCAS